MSSSPCVEVMTCGNTDRAVLDFVIERAREHGHKPFEVLKESSGFIEFVNFSKYTAYSF
jgi:3-hydroxybutyryl-CoA dehydrogenase